MKNQVKEVLLNLDILLKEKLIFFLFFSKNAPCF
jgi:hypothetical protein